jgi:hypothetical protein
MLVLYLTRCGAKVLGGRYLPEGTESFAWFLELGLVSWFLGESGK